MGNRNRFMPSPAADPLDIREIASTNPENYLFCAGFVGARPFEKTRELAESPGADVIQRRHFFVQLFIAPDENLGVLKSKLPNDFCQESGLLQVGFHQENTQIWPNNLQGEAREAPSRTHVGEPTIFHRYPHRRIHTLAKVAIEDLQRVANGCQAYLFIPGQQNLYILLNLKDLVIISRKLEFRQGTADYG